MLAAQGIVIGLIENTFPSPFVFAPGAKLGLANLITVISLFTLPFPQVALLTFVRVSLTALFSGSASSFFFSLCGALLSLLVMSLIKKLGPNRVSIIGISIMGGIFHNIGQLIVARFMTSTTLIFNYLPIMSLSGILAGLVVGIVGNLLLYKLKKSCKLPHSLTTPLKNNPWL
ncbi:Gx transporter family protein [Aerococcus christensenii]